jgi:DNA mismatch endonuclease (patch repair protein)
VADVHDKQTRSRNMAAIRSTDSKAEMLVRRGLHRLGFRFTLHVRKLPGTPDLVFPRHRAIVLVHGCFWHGHDCYLFKWPKTRNEFWRTKIESNKARDDTDLLRLKRLGWRIAVVWECALKGKRQRQVEDVIETVAEWLVGLDPELTVGCDGSTDQNIRTMPTERHGTGS